MSQTSLLPTSLFWITASSLRRVLGQRVKHAPGGPLTSLLLGRTDRNAAHLSLLLASETLGICHSFGGMERAPEQDPSAPFEKKYKSRRDSP